MLIPLHASCARKPSSPRFFLWHPYLTVSHHMNNIKNQIKNNHHLWWKIKKKTKTITARPKSCLPFLLPTSEAECVSTRATDEYELWGMLYMCETTVYPQEPLMNMNYEVCCTCVKPHCIHKSHRWTWTVRYVVHVLNHMWQTYVVCRTHSKLHVQTYLTTGQDHLKPPPELDNCQKKNKWLTFKTEDTV